MHPSPSSRSRYLCLTSCLVALAACGGDDGGTKTCGPGSASDDGLVASGGAAATYGNLAGGLNNDCPGSGAPAGVVSLTIEGTQTDGSGDITFCISRPDQLETGSLALGGDTAGVAVRLIDLGGTTAAGCTFGADPTAAPTGTVSATGLCDDGSNAAGFALTVTATVPIALTCAGSASSATVSIAGTAAVAAMQ